MIAVVGESLIDRVNGKELIGGCAFNAALAASLLRGDCLADAARNAICAGAFASTAETTIHPAMSWKNIEIIRESEELWK